MPLFSVYLFIYIQSSSFTAKANPKLAAENKASADAKRERRKESGSSKTFS